MPTVQFLPANELLVGVAPSPEPTILNIPEWWKNQETFLDNNNNLIGGSYLSTVKKCQAIFDALSTGYVLKAPVDIFLDSNQEKYDVQIPSEWQSMMPHIISGHPKEQVSKMPIDKSIFLPGVLRIHPLWVVKTPSGYSTLFMPPMHSEILPIQAVPAVVDTDKFSSDGHLSFLVKKGFKGVIKKGTPIVQVLPFKRESWDHKLEDYNKKEIEDQRRIVRSTFMNGYRLNFWTKKEYR